MPNYTLTTPGPVYSAAQLGFVGVVTLLLYGVFLYTQTIRHRDFFITDAVGGAEGGTQISNRTFALSMVLLLVSVLAVVVRADKIFLLLHLPPPPIPPPPSLSACLVALVVSL